MANVITMGGDLCFKKYLGRNFNQALDIGM